MKNDLGGKFKARAANVWPMADGEPSPGSAAWLIPTPIDASVAQAESGLLYIPTGPDLTVNLPTGADDGAVVGVVVNADEGVSITTSAAGVVLPYGSENPLQLAGAVLIYSYAADLDVWTISAWSRLAAGVMYAPLPAYDGLIVLNGISDSPVALPPARTNTRVAVLWQGSGASPVVIECDGTNLLTDPLSNVKVASFDCQHLQPGSVVTWCCVESGTWNLESFAGGPAPILLPSGGSEETQLLCGRVYHAEGGTVPNPVLFPADGELGQQVTIINDALTIPVASLGIEGDYGSPTTDLGPLATRRWLLTVSGWRLVERRQRNTGQGLAVQNPVSLGPSLMPEARLVIGEAGAYTLPPGITGMTVAVVRGDIAEGCTVAADGTDAVLDPFTGGVGASADLGAWSENSACTWQFYAGVWYVIAWFEAPTPP